MHALIDVFLCGVSRQVSLGYNFILPGFRVTSGPEDKPDHLSPTSLIIVITDSLSLTLCGGNAPIIPRGLANQSE